MGEEIKLYEIVATVNYIAVIAAESKDAAMEHVATWEKSWSQTGEFLEVLDKELVDSRPMNGDIIDWKDVAHDLTCAARSAYGRAKEEVDQRQT